MMKCHLRAEIPRIVNTRANPAPNAVSVGTSTKESDQDIAVNVPDDAILEGGAQLEVFVADTRPKILRASYPYFERPASMGEDVLGVVVVDPQPETEVRTASKITIRLTAETDEQRQGGTGKRGPAEAQDPSVDRASRP